MKSHYSQCILVFGHGYVSHVFASSLAKQGWKVYCTSRNAPLVADTMPSCMPQVVPFSGPHILEIIAESDAILSTIPPESDSSDPVLSGYATALAAAPAKWIGYLSSTGVYGDHGGNWVDEQTVCSPTGERSRRRLQAEQAWHDFSERYHLPLHVFRLSGIYGPGRNALEDIRNGKDFTVVKPGHFFSRTHVADIARALERSLAHPTPGEIYNISDDEPAPLYEVQQFAAHILKKPPLRELDWEDAHLSAQALAFFNDNKKVSNHKIKQKLGLTWQYPNYRVGLAEGSYAQIWCMTN